MSLLAIIGEALRALRLNRLRTGLTMLGMIIGVAAVVLMLAVGQGAQTTVNQAISSMGSNLFIVVPGATSSGALRSGAGSVQTLTMGDAQAIAHLPSIKATAPLITGTAQLNYGANNWSTSVTGVTPDYFKVRDWPAESGALFTEADLRSAARVVVLGQLTAKNLFGDEDPTGKTIRIKNSPFLVAGVLAPKGQSLDGRDQDDAVFIPIATGQSQIFGNQFPGTIRFLMVQGRSDEVMDEAETEINQLLRQRHRLAEGTENDFTVRNMAALAAVATGAAKVMSIMLGSIASISLLVGGIGIMNIMLVSVTERTREIGIRMAIGANRRAILTQFLLEALVICIMGGLIGVAIGIGGAWAVSQATDMVVVITFGMVALAFAFASAVGIFFGFYPARKAAALKPVEALRYE
ncbi:putative ABC transport system permease protein [Nitrosospira sp. Nsp5]|jgi:putative ABC transport system permease protein|uniref:ABC transport system permease protein n=1 Tax=Nitrosospira multiformis TaxID=1231 RepID=A0ABY0T5Z3_9PROT|nr:MULTISPECIES: ABC transporter permease [Nitrosospira]PTR09464.1 putative ABC transport system permease protein [Nitrosospira sp. Nsp5]SCY25137.1 putative ABC transport system permease protein [Nitrosospira sp. Nsp13]SDQ29372.1 putative ABC transport system permease protein [Nitrosospira multiformis]